MKRTFFPIVFSICFLLFLAACGQGTNNGTEPTTDGIETEENNDLLENEIVDNGDEPINDETNEETVENIDEPSVDTTNDVTTMTIELVFPDDQVMDMYRVKREISGTEEELMYAALESLLAGPTEEEVESGLASLLPEGVRVDSITEEDGVAYVSFSNEFLNAQVGSGPEAMLLQQVAVVMKQFGYEETQILIEGERKDELFGHIDTSVPIEADDLESFEKIE